MIDCSLLETIHVAHVCDDTKPRLSGETVIPQIAARKARSCGLPSAASAMHDNKRICSVVHTIMIRAST